MEFTVLHIIDNMRLGGAQRIVSTCVSRNKNHHLHCLRNTDKSMGDSSDYSTTESRHSYNIASIIDCWKQTRKHDPDIIHCHLVKSKIIGILLKVLCRTKFNLVLHEHGEIWKENNYAYTRMLSYTSSIADQYIAVSKHTAKLLNEKANVPENNIEVIYNFVNREKYNKSQLALIQSDLGDDIKQDAFTVGYGGRLERRKGWRSVIRAARENSEIQFVMCGSGTGSSTVMQKAEKIDNLHYVGFLEDIRMLFSNIDCLLLPSHWDPSPMILYEAQSCGLPVVCTDVQSINELVGQKDALIYQSKNQDALSDRLHELQQNPELRKSLANRSIQNSEKYTFERFQSSIEDTYSSIYTE